MAITAVARVIPDADQGSFRESDWEQVDDRPRQRRRGRRVEYEPAHGHNDVPGWLAAFLVFADRHWRILTAFAAIAIATLMWLGVSAAVSRFTWMGGLKLFFILGSIALVGSLLRQKKWDSAAKAAILLLFLGFVLSMIVPWIYDKANSAGGSASVPTKYVVAPDPNTKFQTILVSSDEAPTIVVPPFYNIWARPERPVEYDAIVHLNQGAQTMKTVLVPEHMSMNPNGVIIGESFDSMTWRVHSKEPVHFLVCVHQPTIPCPEVKKDME